MKLMFNKNTFEGHWFCEDGIDFDFNNVPEGCKEAYECDQALDISEWTEKVPQHTLQIFNEETQKWEEPAQPEIEEVLTQ